MKLYELVKPGQLSYLKNPHFKDNVVTWDGSWLYVLDRTIITGNLVLFDDQWEECDKDGNSLHKY